MKKIRTNRNFRSQKPSWNIAAHEFLARMISSTSRWKQARTNVMRMIADVPMQAEPSPDSLGHCMKDGSTSISFLIVKSIMIATAIIKKNGSAAFATYKIFLPVSD